MGTIRFFLRTDKPDSTGVSPIDVIYSISGQRKYYRTQLKLRPENWSIDQQKAIYLDKRSAKKAMPAVDFNLLPSARDIDHINTELLAIKKDIQDIERRFQLDKKAYSPELVIAALKENNAPMGKPDPSAKLLFDFMDRYIEDHKATREPGSLTVYKVLKNHLRDFQKDKRKSVSFESIDYSFFQDFQNYLIDAKGLNNTTVAKQLSTIKTFLGYARKHGIEVSDKYKDFKIKKQALEVIALTFEEFETLYKMDLSGNKRLAQVRDVFCFACTTGLRYSDLLQLKWEHIKNDEIRLVVKKTKEPLVIPLNKLSSAILSKYKGRHRPLPVISNQKMNEYLKGNEKKKTKGLCELAGINEPVEIVRFRGFRRESKIYPKYQLIGVHTGRKTFATLSMEKGMSAEEVMSITGHKDYKSFKRYVQITEKRKKVVMRNAWGEIKKPNMKAI